MLSFEKWLWWKERYNDRGKSFPGLNDCWFHFWWNPRVIFLEHLANTTFLTVLSDIFSILVSIACENSRFSLLRVAWDVSFSWLNVPSDEERRGTAHAVFAGYGLDCCKFLRVVHDQNIFKKASFQRHVTTYNYPLKRRKSLFWGPKFHNFPGEHAPRPRPKKDRFAPGGYCIGSVFWESK